MKTFITSDIHLNHKQIVKYCPHRVGGIFSGNIDTAIPTDIDKIVHAMNEKIIFNWNSVVNNDDEVYILGDVAMGQIINAPALIQRLNGKKYLIKGNHDKSLHKLIKSNIEYSDLFVWIKDVYEMGYKYNDKKVSLFMSHYPHHSWNGMNQGSLHFFGHLHGSYHGLTGRIMDIGMDTNDLFPYLLDDVVGKLLNIEVIRDHHNNL